MAKHSIKSVGIIAVLGISFVGVCMVHAAPKGVSGPGVTCGPPPKAKPTRMTGGESLPPLPLPATTLRRTERKREPAPPALVAKVAYGKPVWVVVNGQRRQYRDWTTDPDDMKQLLRWTNAKLGIRYRSFDTDLRKCSFDPAEIPVLYFTGHQGLPKLSEAVRTKLRQYVLDGGTIVGDACCGAKDFTRAFRQEMAAIFPRRELARLPEDHPLFASFYRINQVRVKKNDEYLETLPYVEGINIGCRTAVIFFPIDVSCGWDGHVHPDREGVWYSVRDARTLGANLVTYVLANYQYGRMFSTEKKYYEAGKGARGEFIFAQARHNGDWDPTPHGVPNLLKYLQENSTVDTAFKRTTVNLSELDAFETPIVYLTGLRAPRLSDAERARVREFLDNGGVLVIDAAAGSRAFDQAMRAELARIRPKQKLKLLKLDHPLYKAVFDCRQVRYAPMLTREQPGLTVPIMEGIIKDGQLCILYSRFGLGAGWEQLPNPYNRGYADRDALRLGVNALVYAMTH